MENLSQRELNLQKYIKSEEELKKEEKKQKITSIIRKIFIYLFLILTALVKITIIAVVEKGLAKILKDAFIVER